MKKVLSMVLALVMVIGVFTAMPVTASAASVDDLYFHLNEDGESYTLDNCHDSAEGKLVIPSEYNGLPVTNICEYAFVMCTKLTSVTIPDSILTIGAWAFTNCENLKSVTIGSGVEDIGALSFYNCKKLDKINVVKSNEDFSSVDGVLFNKDKTVLIQYPEGKIAETYKIPETVKSIGKNAFAFNTSIKSVVIPGSVKKIEEGAFQYCLALSTVTMGKGITYLGEQAFAGCIFLESFEITKNVKTIADGVFLGCFYLKKVTVDEENDYFVAANNVLFDKNKTTLIMYPAGKTNKFYIIPSSVKYIELAAFAGATFEKVTIPDSVKEISEGAFYHCTNLKSVQIPESVTKIKNMAFGYYSTGTPEMEKIEGFTIYGTKETAAEKYAKKNDFTFKAACEHKSTKWVTDKKATVYKTGSKHKECANCGEVIKAAKIAQLKCTKPTLKTISNTQYGVKITWGTVKGADKYYIYRKTSSGSYSKIATIKNTYYTDKTAKSCKKYYYVVKAVNEAGNSASSSAKAILYLADTKLKTPSSTKSGVKLTWSKVTGADGYQVWRKSGSGSYSKIATVKGNSKVTYTDKSAKKGKTYTYKIKVYKSKTTSAFSNTKKITDKY